MADPTVVAVDPSMGPPPETGDFGSGLHVPPVDDTFFSQCLFNGDGDAMGNQNDDMVALDDLDFDFSFEDLGLAPSDGLDHILNQTQLQQSNCQHRSGSDFAQFQPDFCQLDGVFKSTASELCHLTGDGDFSGDQSWGDSALLNSDSPDMDSHQISNYLNIQSPESNGSNRESAENCGANGKGLSCHSPESQGSGNFESNVSEDSNNCAARSVSSSPISFNSSVKTGVVDQKIKLEESAKNDSNICFLKRKKEGDDLLNSSVESRINKLRKSNCNSENNDCKDSDVVLDEEEDKKKARLLRNRESAQLSRQRKKHYVEELEDKVRNMHSTIQDLNAKISYFMAENATLKHQMGGNGGGGSSSGGATAPSAVPPPPMAPPHPGMYTHPAMMYPWMPYAPPYMMKSQGSQVPLVPIPRLKPQQQAHTPKPSKKVESKKNEAPKTKKVAGVSFLGLLFFIMLFGGLVPMVNVRYGGTREAFTGGESYIRGGFNERHHGRVLMVNGTEFDEKHSGSGQRGQSSGGEHPSVDRSGNGSEPLAASLYVPRNDKLVKIDGNLIIHSVLASEKAMASKGKGYGETGLVVPGDLAHAIPGPVVGRNGARHTLLRTLGSGSVDNDGTKSTASDGKLQQWFREGLAGPMLSAGMCTEVFQFDVSAAIVPATSRNITEEQIKNSTHPSKTRNRRILHPIPFPESSRNISGENARSEKEELNINNKTSSMVVSVLFDPREAGDADVDGVMGTKSLTRIFVVVLIDSVKYVTYSCMLPFKGSAPHLVTT